MVAARDGVDGQREQGGRPRAPPRRRRSLGRSLRHLDTLHGGAKARLQKIPRGASGRSGQERRGDELVLRLGKENWEKNFIHVIY